MDTRYRTRSRTRRAEKNRKRLNRLKRHSNASSSDEESDVDECGNIRDLIDYDYDLPKTSPTRSRTQHSHTPERSHRQSRRRRILSTESESESVSLDEDENDLITKMLVLQELCNHVEEMKRHDRESYSEDSDSDYVDRSSSTNDDSEHLDHEYSIKKTTKSSLRRNLTRSELKYYKKIDPCAKSIY